MPDRLVWLQQAGLLTAIPFVLLVGPAIGYFLGSALDNRWSHAPWGVGIGIIFGFLASARTTAQLIQQALKADAANKRQKNFGGRPDNGGTPGSRGGS